MILLLLHEENNRDCMYSNLIMIRIHISFTPPLYIVASFIQMLDFLIDNIFVLFCGRVFQQTVGIPMGTN